jgi:hypothetical protein
MLFLLSTTPVVQVAKFATGVVDTSGKFLVNLDLQNLKCYFQGLGEDDSWKKT